MAEQFKATVAGGHQIATGSLVPTALACLQHLKRGTTVFVRSARDLTVTVELSYNAETFKDNRLTMTATTYGVSCEPPDWAHQLSNFIKWEIPE